MSNFAGAVIEYGNPPVQVTLLSLMKKQLGIEDYETCRDDELSMYLDMAGAACERYIDNIINERDVKESFKTDQHPIALRYNPVTALVGISVDGEDVLEDYELFHEEGLHWSVKNRCGWHEGSCFEQMILTYTAGYNPLPADLAFAVVTASRGYESGTGGSIGGIKKEVISGVGSIEYNTDDSTGGSVGLLAPSVTGVLDTYMRKYA